MNIERKRIQSKKTIILRTRRMVKLWAATILISSCFPAARHPNSGNQTEQLQKEIETNIRVPVIVTNIASKKYSLIDRMKFFEVPGVSVVLIEHGKEVWSKGYGHLEEGKTKKVDTNTIFQAASMSKPFTALGVLALVKKGLVNLDANVNDYLISWKIQKRALTKTEKVTIRKLLSHTAGLTDSNGFPGYKVGRVIPTLVEILNTNSPHVNSVHQWSWE